MQSSNYYLDHFGPTADQHHLLQDNVHPGEPFIGTVLHVADVEDPTYRPPQSTPYVAGVEVPTYMPPQSTSIRGWR
jgi:hypothetical protein